MCTQYVSFIQLTQTCRVHIVIFELALLFFLFWNEGLIKPIYLFLITVRLFIAITQPPHVWGPPLLYRTGMFKVGGSAGPSVRPTLACIITTAFCSFIPVAPMDRWDPFCLWVNMSLHSGGCASFSPVMVSSTGGMLTFSGRASKVDVLVLWWDGKASLWAKRRWGFSQVVHRTTCIQLC